jgi:hypothetical protein
MTIKHSTGRRAKATALAARKSERRREAERAQAKLNTLREQAEKAFRKIPVPANPLIDTINAEGTLGNIATVTCFLEHWEPVDGSAPSEAEEGRWRIQQWINDTLVYAQAQMKREQEIAAAIVFGLQGSEEARS